MSYPTVMRIFDAVSSLYARILTANPASNDNGLVVREVNRSRFLDPADAPATYSAIAHNIAIAAAGTDFFTITNPAGSGKVLRINEVGISGTQTSVGVLNFHAIKRSTVNSGGTSTSKTVVPHDSTNPASVATVLAYTVNPTLGTSVGSVRDFWKSINRTNDTTTGEHRINFGDNGAQPIVLREGEVFALNFVGQTSAGNNFCCYAQWTQGTV